MSEMTRPLPHPTQLSAPHWDGARVGRLMVQHCQDCGTYVFIPRHACNECFSPRLEWVESSGRGTVYSYTIIHRPMSPAFVAPYCAAIIELEEGWHMISHIVDTAVDDVAVGMTVAVHYVDMGPVTLPMFRPV